jgi:hypothetical protein
MNIPPIVHARVAPAAQGHAQVAPAARQATRRGGHCEIKDSRLRTFFEGGDVFIAERTLCSSS